MEGDPEPLLLLRGAEKSLLYNSLVDEQTNPFKRQYTQLLLSFYVSFHNFGAASILTVTLPKCFCSHCSQESAHNFLSP